MEKILIFTQWFIPGFKAGGPIQSCNNLAEYMKEEKEMYVLTGDRDFGDKSPYDGIVTNQWVTMENGVHVYYLPPIKKGIFNVWKIIKNLNPDYFYLSGIYSMPFNVYPLIYHWKKKTNIKVILTPRGVLRDSALKYNPFKKKVLIYLLRSLGVFNGTYFHATDPQEAMDIKKWLNPPIEKIYTLGNLPLSRIPERKNIKKNKGFLNIVYISRINPIKNLLFTLKAIKKSKQKGEINFSIYGPIEDEKYWASCQDLMSSMPNNISVKYHGLLVHNQVIKTLQKHHFYILPTEGENFGHSIFEAFVAARPVIISDQTPWKGLEKKKVGWDFSLEKNQGFVSAIDYSINMEQEEFNLWSENAWSLAKDYIDNNNLKSKYTHLFS